MINIPEEIKMLFKSDSILKNIRIHFPNCEREDITNSQIYADNSGEKFSFTESLCSRNKLKFGLCEASYVEFECVGIENIEGYEIEVFHEIDISSLPDEFIAEYGMTSDDVTFPFYRIPYGKFIVDKCPRSADMKKRSVVAYDKLNSRILDYDKSEQLNKYFASNPVCVPKIVYTLEKLMLQDFSINHERTMVPIEFKHSLGDSTSSYTGNLVSVNGKKTTFEVRTRTYKFQNIDSSEIYDVVFSNVGMFIQVQSLLKYYKDTYSFTMGSDDYWWLRHGLQIELTDGNSGTVVFNEVYDPEGYLSEDIIKILGYGNISEMKFSILSYINLHFYEDETDEEGRDVQQSIDSETADTLIDSITLEKLSLYDIEKMPIPPVLSSCTLRNVLNAVYEINGTFASINRISGMLEERSAGRFSIYPSETLYPGGNLYPISTENILTKLHKPVWYDDSYTPLYSKVTCTYKDSTTQENTYLEHTIIEVKNGKENKCQTYDISGNYLIKEKAFTEAQIKEILATIASNIERVRYMPSDIKLIGRPDLEAGDVVQIVTNESKFETIVLRRTLIGIQSLVDNFESKG